MLEEEMLFVKILYIKVLKMDKSKEQLWMFGIRNHYQKKVNFIMIKRLMKEY